MRLPLSDVTVISITGVVNPVSQDLRRFQIAQLVYQRLDAGGIHRFAVSDQFSPDLAERVRLRCHRANPRRRISETEIEDLLVSEILDALVQGLADVRRDLEDAMTAELFA